MVVDSHSFRNALGCFASGVTVVTAVTKSGEPVGVTVSAFSSLSLNPPLVLVCLDKNTSNLEAYRAGAFAVNLLTESQKEISIRFATRPGNRWDNTEHVMGEGGCPLLTGCLANLECTLEATHEAGDHVIIVGRVRELRYAAGGQPLLYFRSAYAGLGRLL
ncbi:MAG: flavin reductase family protein [Alphaproteobacteria bacterium]